MGWRAYDDDPAKPPPEPKEPVYVDYNPDHHPSMAGMWIEKWGGKNLWVLRVRGLGAIVLTAADSKTFNGVSALTTDMIEFDDGLDKEFADAVQRGDGKV